MYAPNNDDHRDDGNNDYDEDRRKPNSKKYIDI